jgi:hypothetical protein
MDPQAKQNAKNWEKILSHLLVILLLNYFFHNNSFKCVLIKNGDFLQNVHVCFPFLVRQLPLSLAGGSEPCKFRLYADCPIAWVLGVWCNI